MEMIFYVAKWALSHTGILSKMPVWDNALKKLDIKNYFILYIEPTLISDSMIKYSTIWLLN